MRWREGAGQREEVAEVMFEALGVPTLCLAAAPLLALLSTGQTTGNHLLNPLEREQERGLAMIHLRGLQTL